jgi:hypothetical protein
VRRLDQDTVSSIGGPADTYAGAALLLNDMRVVLLLLNDKRYRVLQRYLGVPRDQANLVTWVAVLMAAEAMAEGAGRVRRAIPGPSVADSALGATVTSEVFYRLLGGLAASDTQLVGTLVLIVVVGKQLGKGGRGMVADIRSWSRRTLNAFSLRYRDKPA